ncbi:MAG: toll/interleukin-1 receptor domain-containing protein [Hyphomonadaceae bacterium]
MPSVVIIHAAQDTLPARALAEKLRQAQVQVILEKPPGEELRAAVKGAPVTIALWSPRSNQDNALTDEVAFARGKSKVFHAQMQSAPVPDQFRGDKAVNLTGWRGEDEFEPWRELAKLVTDKAGVAPLPPPAPRPPSGFFQPGRPAEAAQAAPAGQKRAAASQPRQAPPPRAVQSAPRPAQQQRAAPPPRNIPAPAAEPKKGGGMVIIAAVVFVLVAALGGGGYYFMTQNQASATSAAWDAVSRDDADAIRAFLSDNPGEHRDEAEAALAELENSTYASANRADTIEAYEAFLNDFPESDRATRARGRIAELRTLTPASEAEALPELPELPATDPDLLPPGTETAPDTGGPTPITPPAEDTNVPPAEQPTN